jgi:hypothetical protein
MLHNFHSWEKKTEIFKLMKQGHILAILSFLLISLTTCEYDPHGIFERDLNQKPEAPRLETVNLDLSQEKDTIVLLYNRVCFHFRSSNQDIRQVIFILDDSLIGRVESGSGFFDMQVDSLYSGYHRLKLEIITKTGTGSIADSLGMEGILFATREWTIKMRYTPYSVLTSTVSEGFLKLQWPKPYETASDFIVYRYNVELGRTNECEFIDRGYVGEGGTFHVRYYSKSGQLIDYGWVEIPNEIEVKYTSDEKNNYAVEWEKPKYYAAIDTIVVYGYGDDDHFSIQKTADISTTRVEIPPSYFGQLRSYWLGFIPKYSNPVYDECKSPYPRFVSPEIQCMIGYPSPIFEHFSRTGKSEFIYHTYKYDQGSTADADSMFRYSTLDNRIIERYRYNPPDYPWSGDHYREPAFSPDGSHFTAVVAFTETALYGQSQNLQNYKITDISNLTSGASKIPISNVGTGIVNGSGIKYLYDFENEKILGSVDNSVSLSDYNISADGKYLFLSSYYTTWLFSYENGILTSEDTIQTYPGFDYFNFMSDDPGKIVGWNNDSKDFSFLRCPDMQILGSFKVNEDEILDIDYNDDRILSFKPGLLVVRSLVDGSVQYEIPVKFKILMYKGFYLGGNSIFYQKGARYFLN